jgi:hypothetical protein
MNALQSHQSSETVNGDVAHDGFAPKWQLDRWTLVHPRAARRLCLHLLLDQLALLLLPQRIRAAQGLGHQALDLLSADDKFATSNTGGHKRGAFKTTTNTPRNRDVEVVDASLCPGQTWHQAALERDGPKVRHDLRRSEF